MHIIVYFVLCPIDDVCQFQLVPEVTLKNQHEAENTQLIEYGYTRKNWEKDALALAWKKEDLKADKADLCMIIYDRNCDFKRDWIKNTMKSADNFLTIRSYVMIKYSVHD